jgi:hypothetical protein
MSDKNVLDHIWYSIDTIDEMVGGCMNPIENLIIVTHG